MFKFIPRRDYLIGEKIVAGGVEMRIVGRSIATELNWVGQSADGRRYVLIATDSQPIVGVPAQ